jgi:hypothetical protein
MANPDGVFMEQRATAVRAQATTPAQQAAGTPSKSPPAASLAASSAASRASPPTCSHAGVPVPPPALARILDMLSFDKNCSHLGHALVRWEFPAFWACSHAVRIASILNILSFDANWWQVSRLFFRLSGDGEGASVKLTQVGAEAHWINPCHKICKAHNSLQGKKVRTVLVVTQRSTFNRRFCRPSRTK